MALKLEQKKAITSELSEEVSNALSIITADYRGLTSPEMTDLRAQARKLDVKLKIVRNTLVKRAIEGSAYSCLSDSLAGPTILALSSEASAAARLIRDFSKDHENLEVKSVCLEGKLFDKSQLNAVASLPNKEEALSQLLSVMQAPIVKLVRTVKEPHAKLVRLIAAIRDQKQASGS